MLDFSIARDSKYAVIHALCRVWSTAVVLFIVLMTTPLSAATSSTNTLPQSSSAIAPPITPPSNVTLDGISNISIQTGGNPFLLMSGFYSAGEQNLVGSAGDRSTNDGSAIEIAATTVPCNGICTYSPSFFPSMNIVKNFGIPTSKQMCDQYIAGTGGIFRSYTESTCQLDPGDPGKRCVQQTDANPAYCDVQIKTNLNKVCPLGFTPFVHININSARNIGDTSAFACISDPYNAGDGPKLSGPFSKTTFPYRKGVYQINGKYAFTVRMSGAPTHSQILPGVSFDWLLFCYPHQSTPPLPPPCGKSRTADAPPSILLWDTGTIEYVETKYPAATQSVSTHRRCPLGYNPYATISAGASTQQSQDQLVDLPSQQGICVASVSTNASNHTIFYVAVSTNISVNYGTQHLVIDSYSPNNYLTPVRWNLYCLPFGIPVPDYFPAKCSPAYKAYKPGSDGETGPF